MVKEAALIVKAGRGQDRKDVGDSVAGVRGVCANAGAYGSMVLGWL